MSYNTSNQTLCQHLVQGASKDVWNAHHEAIAARLYSDAPARTQRQLQLFLEKHARYDGVDALHQQQLDHESVVQWIVYQAFEESFTQAGRERVVRRHFPAQDTALWRKRAHEVGGLFLLAREFLRGDANESLTLRTVEAIELAEHWMQGRHVPSEVSLEPYLVLMWYRRCLDIIRQLARDEQRVWQETSALDDATYNDHMADDRAEESLHQVRPDLLLQGEESFSVLCGVFLSVARDGEDEQILRGKLNDETENDLAAQLTLTRAQVRSRWNTLVERAQVLFKCVSLAERAATPITQVLDIEGLRHALACVEMQPRSRQMNEDFWLLWLRLSTLLEQRREHLAARDQSVSWNALSQSWKRALLALIELDMSTTSPELLRRLVYYWSHALELTQTVIPPHQTERPQELSTQQEHALE
ncbi:MAG TPA: hypothetical protein DCE42_08760 [Myxococcales bacterium]|nr:hypothetical protein [Myxococcales bacterium]|tara:strand:- start:1482 stop:2732 length:1251 start_codon:yes stop_codon:yes gene_type:complete